METSAFEGAVDRLRATAEEGRVAVMCAEAIWWRCHRGLIADYLTASGVCVLHIGGDGRVTEHPLTAAARLVDGRLSYAGDPTLGL
jgi:uncharacterized protein (DUF488 family)